MAKALNRSKFKKSVEKERKVKRLKLIRAKLFKLKMKKHKAFLYLSLPLIFITFIPALFFDFAYSDDYFGLWQQRFSDDWTGSAIEHGRPLQGFVISTIFSCAATVSGLWKIRAISILILSTISYMLYTEFLIFFKGNSLLAAIFSLLPVFLPSFEIITVWVSTFPAIISLALSLLAGKLLLFNVNTTIKRISLSIFAFILLIISLLTYQAGVAACLLPSLIRSPRFIEESRPLKLFIRPLLIFIISNVTYIIAFKIYQIQSTIEIGRSAISSVLLHKMEWFFIKPFVYAGSSFAALETKEIRLLVLFITILLFSISVFLFVKRVGWKQYWWFPIVFSLSFPLSYYTNILAAESFYSYRTQAVLSCVFTFGLAMVTYELIKEKFRWVGGLILLSLFFIIGAKNLYNDFILLQNHDWKTMIQVINNNAHKKKINLLRTNRNIVDQKNSVITIEMDEFGIPGSSVEWATESMIKLVLVDVLHKSDTSLSIQIFNERDTNAYSNIEPLIRLNSNFNNY